MSQRKGRIESLPRHSTALPHNGYTLGLVQCYGEDFWVVSLDADAKMARLANGAEIAYDALVTTQPLDATLTWLGKAEWAHRLSHRCGLAEPSCEA